MRKVAQHASEDRAIDTVEATATVRGHGQNLCVGRRGGQVRKYVHSARREIRRANPDFAIVRTASRRAEAVSVGFSKAFITCSVYARSCSVGELAHAYPPRLSVTTTVTTAEGVTEAVVAAVVAPCFIS